MELKGIISDSLVSGTIRNGARLNGTVLVANTGATQNDHSVALNRDLPNQHPMSAITGLPEVFWATYNETSYADIRAAYDAGKTVLLHHPDNIILPLKQFGYDDWMQADYAEFYGVVGLASPYVYEARCDASQNFWTRTRSLLATSGTTGALSNLDTTAKNNLVAAVNEVNAKAAGTFWATYNTTPYADIVAAHNAGKAVFVKESGVIYSLDYVAAHYVTFSLFSVSSLAGQQGSFNEAYCYGIKVTEGEVWSTYDDELALKSDIGSRADLTTTAKDNLVAAVNEVNAKADTLVVYRFTVSSTNYNNLAKGAASVTSGPTAAEVLAAAAELSSSDKTILAIVTLAGGTGRSYVVPLTYFKGTNPYPVAGFSGFIDNRMDIVLYTNGNSWVVRFKDYSAEILEAEDRLLDIIGDDTALTTTDKSDLVSAINEINAKASGDGLTDAAKQALLQLARKVAYVDENGEEYYQDLYEALYNEQTYTVTNNLTDVTNSNAATRVAQGGSYSATLTPTSGYTINSVTVTMGGNDVTGTAYSSGTISIANVTGNIVITAVATQRQATLLSITATFSQGSAVIYDDASLDSLKQYLAVTANYDDSSSETLADSAYTLSGTLTAGTSTITASYGGKSDTFNVTVTSLSYVSDGLVMWLDGEKNSENGAHVSNLTTWVDQSGNGWDFDNVGATVNAKSLSFNGTSQYLKRAYDSLPHDVRMMEVVVKRTSGICVINGFGNNYIGNITFGSTGTSITFQTGTGTGDDKNSGLSVPEGIRSTVFSANSAGYLNGETVSVSTNSNVWQYRYPCIGAYLGSGGNNFQYGFSGEIYCIRMYNRILTEQEILANYAVDVHRFGIGG